MKTEEAFSILHQQACDELEAIQSQGAALFEQADFAGVREAADRAEAVKAVIGTLEELQERWQRWIPKRVAEPGPEPLVVEKRPLQRGGYERTPHGLLTPRETYRTAILQALVEMGGSGRVKDVVDRVGEMLKDVFNDLDLAPLENRQGPRWRKSTAWTRVDMVNDGYLRSDSPRGVWEITDEGRHYLSNLSSEN